MIVDPLTASAALAALAAAIPSSSVAAQVRLIPSSKAAFACSSYEGASSSFEVAFTLTFLASTKEASSFAKQAAIAATATTTTVAFVKDKADQVKESQLLAVQAQLVMVAANQIPHFKVGVATLALANYSKIQEKEKQSLLSLSQFIIRPSLFETDVIHLDADFQPTSSHLAFKKWIEDQD